MEDAPTPLELEDACGQQGFDEGKAFEEKSTMETMGGDEVCDKHKERQKLASPCSGFWE